MRSLVRKPELYAEPRAAAPPLWIRLLLFFTCTGVSFAHGSNDGQKGMGLIMLILIGTVPIAYALNHAVAFKEVQNFIAVSEKAERTLEKYAGQSANALAHAPIPPEAKQSDRVPPDQVPLEKAISERKIEPETPAQLSRLIDTVKDQVAGYRSLA